MSVFLARSAEKNPELTQESQGEKITGKLVDKLQNVQ